MWRKNGGILSVEGKKGFFDLAYGDDSDDQKIDVWLPEGEGPFPAILSIHGGGFIACDKRQADMITPMLEGLNRGYAVIGINYRLIEEAIFPYPVMDIKQAIKYICANAEKLNIKADKLVPWGGSAGGYMTLMACLSSDSSLFDNEKDPNKNVLASVCGGVVWYPITDFESCDEQLKINSVMNKFLRGKLVDKNENEYEPAYPISEESSFPFHNTKESVSSRFVGALVSGGEDVVKKASPINYIHKDMVKLFIQHGSCDEIVPMQQSILFTLKANEVCEEERVKLDIIPDAIHSSVMFETKENINRIFDFIDDLVK